MSRDDEKRVLILSIKAGSGHMRAAAAIEAALQEEHPEVVVRHDEALRYTSASFREAFTRTYNRLATDLPSIWGLIYEHLEEQPADSRTKKLGTLVDRLNSREILKAVNDFRATHVVCTHYFPAEILAAYRRKELLRRPVSVVLTDYDIHTMWIQDGVDHYFVATDAMAYALHVKGIGDAGVSVTGIPVMPDFGRDYPGRAEMRRRLGLRAEPPTVLVAAGGFGMGNLDQTVAMLADMLDDVQFLAVAGTNHRLHGALKKVAVERPGKIVPFGFVNNMHELMAASDFAVTKSGGLTSSECLALGLPMIIVSPIPGQEERNADFLLENGVALRANAPAHLIYKVRQLIADPERQESMREAIRRVAKPRAAMDIAAEVLGQA